MTASCWKRASESWYRGVCYGTLDMRAVCGWHCKSLVDSKVLEGEPIRNVRWPTASVICQDLNGIGTTRVPGEALGRWAMIEPLRRLTGKVEVIDVQDGILLLPIW